MSEKSDRVVLNDLVRMISAMNSDRGPDLKIQAAGVGFFQVILKGKRATLLFEGEFKDCFSYLYGVRDMVTAGG